MIQNYFDNVKRILGSLISNARAPRRRNFVSLRGRREGWGKGIYLFPFLKIGGSPAERAKAGGQKGRGFRSVMSPGIFARPPFLAEFLPRLRRGSRSISFKIGSDLVV